MDHLTSVKTRLRDMSQREEELYLQMKKSIELVEQAQLEQTEVAIRFYTSNCWVLTYTKCHIYIANDC